MSEHKPESLSDSSYLVQEQNQKILPSMVHLSCSLPENMWSSSHALADELHATDAVLPLTNEACAANPTRCCGYQRWLRSSMSQTMNVRPERPRLHTAGLCAARAQPLPLHVDEGRFEGVAGARRTRLLADGAAAGGSVDADMMKGEEHEPLLATDLHHKTTRVGP